MQTYQIKIKHVLLLVLSIISVSALAGAVANIIYSGYVLKSRSVLFPVEVSYSFLLIFSSSFTAAMFFEIATSIFSIRGYERYRTHIQTAERIDAAKNVLVASSCFFFMPIMLSGSTYRLQALVESATFYVMTYLLFSFFIFISAFAFSINIVRKYKK